MKRTVNLEFLTNPQNENHSVPIFFQFAMVALEERTHVIEDNLAILKHRYDIMK